MDVSLDEYIARNKSVGNWKAIQGKSERKFKAERHEEGSDDDDDDAIFETNDIGKCRSSGINYIDLDMPDEEENDQTTLKTPGFDLRNKISGTEESIQGDIPKANSQQWRIMRPNVLNQRPAGMPPLVPQSAVEESRSQNGLQKKSQVHRNNRKNFYNKNGRKNAKKNDNCINWAFKGYNNGNTINRRFNNNGSNINSGCNYNRYSNNGYNNNLYNNKNVYNSSGSNNTGFCNNLNPYNKINNNCTNGYIKGGNNVVNNLYAQRVDQRNSELVTPEVHDLTIECPAESIELFPTNSVAQRSLMIAPGNKSMQSSEDNSEYRQNNSLRALLNINNPQYQASKALEILQSIVEQPQHKPLYDLKIQKEIHAIQKKPLLYKCPGGDVVSSDGNGINCEIIPRTSGVSLNHRFA